MGSFPISLAMLLCGNRMAHGFEEVSEVPSSRGLSFTERADDQRQVA